jgi:hypothetical protein
LNVTAVSAKYSDLAERYVADAVYEPGTVLEFGGNGLIEVRLSSQDMTPCVAGVVTTAPSFLMNEDMLGDFLADIALQGRVPTKVVGPVGKGDMMVATADGRARSEANPKIGTVIGKALENFIATDEHSESVIEVVIGKT